MELLLEVQHLLLHQNQFLQLLKKMLLLKFHQPLLRRHLLLLNHLQIQLILLLMVLISIYFLQGLLDLMLIRFSLLLLKEVVLEQRFVPRPLKKMQKNSVLNCLQEMLEMLHKSCLLLRITKQRFQQVRKLTDLRDRESL